MISGLTLLGSVNTKFWYLLPLVVAISLVYGGTRHETLTQIIAHAIRSMVWLTVFWIMIFCIVWLSGFGTAADLLTAWDVQKVLAMMAWVFGALWIAGNVFPISSAQGLICILTGGIGALVLGIRSCRSLWSAAPVEGKVPSAAKAKESTSNSSSDESESVAPLPMPLPVVLMLAALIWSAVAWWIDR